jgi:site-specific recombinase XerD
MFNIDHYLSKLEEFFLLRNLTDNTRKNYISSIRRFLLWLIEYSIIVEDATYDHIRRFLYDLRTIFELSPRTVNYYCSKIRFLWIYVLNKSWDPYQVPMAKFDSKLPEVISHEDAIYFITSLENLRDKAICALMYGSGLRISEVSHLKYDDISRKNMNICIRKSKSREARLAILSERTLEILEEYWFKYGKPRDYLFPGRDRVKPVTSKTILNHLKKHAQTLGWNHNNITCHMFRHGFALYIYDHGADLLTIQFLLGHKSIQSTTIYVRLSRINKLDITSPMDWDQL